MNILIAGVLSHLPEGVPFRFGLPPLNAGNMMTERVSGSGCEDE